MTDYNSMKADDYAEEMRMSENEVWFDGVLYVAVDEISKECAGCHFHEHSMDAACSIAKCQSKQRKDIRNVNFVEKK